MLLGRSLSPCPSPSPWPALGEPATVFFSSEVTFPWHGAGLADRSWLGQASGGRWTAGKGRHGPVFNKQTPARLAELEWGQHSLRERRRQFSLATMFRDFSVRKEGDTGS